MSWSIDQSDDELEAILTKAREFIELIARMKTDGEIQDETEGDDCMSGDDAVMTLGELIVSARELLDKEG